MLVEYVDILVKLLIVLDSGFIRDINQIAMNRRFSVLKRERERSLKIYISLNT